MVRLTKRQIGLDESGVDRQPLRIPHARIRRRSDIFSDRFDVAIADDDRRTVESFTGLNNYLAADERVNSDGTRAKTGRKDFAESNRGDAE